MYNAIIYENFDPENDRFHEAIRLGPALQMLTPPRARRCRVSLSPVLHRSGSATRRWRRTWLASTPFRRWRVPAERLAAIMAAAAAAAPPAPAARPPAAAAAAAGAAAPAASPRATRSSSHPRLPRPMAPAAPPSAKQREDRLGLNPAPGSNAAGKRPRPRRSYLTPFPSFPSFPSLRSAGRLRRRFFFFPTDVKMAFACRSPGGATGWPAGSAGRLDRRDHPSGGVQGDFDDAGQRAPHPTTAATSFGCSPCTLKVASSKAQDGTSTAIPTRRRCCSTTHLAVGREHPRLGAELPE